MQHSATEIVNAFLGTENRRDWASLGRFCDESIAYELAGGKKVQGKEDYLRHMQKVYSQIPDQKFEITKLVGDETTVFAEFDGKGHFTWTYENKEYRDVPLRLTSVCIFYVEESKIKRIMEYWDPVSYELQLKAHPVRQTLCKYPKKSGIVVGNHIQEDKMPRLMTNYYLDTSIWMDILENRGIHAEYARLLILSVVAEDGIILYSDLHLTELKNVGYTMDEIRKLFQAIKPERLRHVHIHKHHLSEAKKLAIERGVPKKDALHAILAHDYEALLISRDRHFERLRSIVETKRPEDVH